MADAPELDGRRAPAIRRDVDALAPNYTDEWRADAAGVGEGLVDVFSELGAEVTEGTPLGTVYDPASYEVRQEAEADRDGVLYSITQEATVKAGDTLGNVAWRP